MNFLAKTSQDDCFLKDFTKFCSNIAGISQRSKRYVVFRTKSAMTATDGKCNKDEKLLAVADIRRDQ